MKMPFSIPALGVHAGQSIPSRGVRAEVMSGGSESSSPSVIMPSGSGAAVHSGEGAYSVTETLLNKVKQAAGFAKKGLSDAARSKLVLIGERAANARGVTDKVRNDIDQLKDGLARAELDISIQENDHSRNRDIDPEPVVLLKAREDAALIKAEISRLQSKTSEYLAISTATAELFSALSKYVARIKDGARPYTIAVEPRVLDGEGQGDSVERLRRRIRELRSDLDAVRCAPYPSSESKIRLRAEIDELAEAGTPNVFELIDRRGKIIWPVETSRTISPAIGADGSSHLTITTVPNALAVLAWLHRDTLLARLHREIDASSQDDQALTDEQRTKKAAQILSDVLATEREEEALIERMEATGAQFLRRTDADPRAVLGLSSEMPAPDVERR